MRIRRWTTWFLALALVLALAPDMVMAQDSGGEAGGDAFLVVVSLIWDQLGLGEVSEDGAAAPEPNQLAGIGTEGGDEGNTGDEMGPFISPDG